MENNGLSVIRAVEQERAVIVTEQAKDSCPTATLNVHHVTEVYVLHVRVAEVAMNRHCETVLQIRNKHTMSLSFNYSTILNYRLVNSAK